MTGLPWQGASTDWAFDRYEAVRPRLPPAEFPARPVAAANLEALADRYDAFILDAFGVLNVGATPIPGAVDRMARLRAMGKRLVVLTNAASYPRAEAVASYCRLGFDFAETEVVSSRDVAVLRLEAILPGGRWAALGAAGDGFADMARPPVDAIDHPEAFDSADGFLFLSQSRWTPALQDRLARALTDRPRPLVVANPDIVAPREGGLTLEPGAFAHDLADCLGLRPHWFGKPFPEAFADALARLPGIPPHRIATVGDTLHSNILGGRAAGVGAVLVARHGLFAGRDPAPYIARSGILPDAIIADP